MRDVYAVCLTGGGDVDIKLVDEETFRWITNPDHGRMGGPGFVTNWTDTLIPASQLAKIGAATPSDQWKLRVTIGSYNNDRALMAVADAGDSFTDLKGFLLAIRERDLNVLDVFEGEIY